MVAVAIVSTVGAMGTVVYRRAVSGATSPAFARSFVTLVHEARHRAMTLGRSTRLRIVPGSTGLATVIRSEVLDPADATNSTWLVNTSTSAPLRIEFCEPAVGVSLVSATPTCPITTAMNSTLCIAPNGRASLAATGGVCPGTGSATASQPSTGAGATIYFRGTQEQRNDVRYKVLVWGLTGLPKLVDQW